MPCLLRIVLLALLVVGCDGPSRPRQPDLLLVTLDTLRADRLGAYGAGADRTPALDRLAAEGVVFEHMLAASSRTAPSHASLFTGRFPNAHSVGFANGSTRLEGAETLATRLSRAGYATAAFVGNSMLRRRIGLDRGFALYDDALPDVEANRPVFERVAAKTTARALDWLAQPRTRPRFLWVHLNDAHGPYTPDASRVRPESPAPTEAPLPVLAIDRGLGGIPAYQVVGDERLPSQYLARYAGEIRTVDEAVGRLRAAFVSSAGEDGVVVAVTADHGEALGEEGIWFSHGFGTAPALAHVPFLLAADGLAPRRVAGVVHHVDVAPTLLEALGVERPAEGAGLSLLPMARGEAEPPSDRLLFVDVGEEVSAYQGERFTRLRFGPTVGPVVEGSRSTHRWRTDVDWPAVEPAPALERAIEAYVAARVPLVAAPPPDEADVERLKALGYGVP